MAYASATSASAPVAASNLYTSTGAILVLFILLVIITRAGLFGI
jgi:uncharacterized protein (TIGR01732 family)